MAENALGKSDDTADRLNKLFLTIISRYSEYIEEHENLSVAELPTLITPKNGAIITKADEIKSHFGAYKYDKDFNNASIKAFDFVKENVTEVVLPLQFWLVPEETLAFMMGDAFDRNVLLCTMLIALGNPSAKVLVAMKGDSRKIFVYYEHQGFVLFDINDGTKQFKTKEELLESLRIGDETTAYEFNDNVYTNII